ncbi:HlyD family type I secretion periplasmic adaptor subunit [Poseidonocella sp. HB161398]|uniref:HlyD family type I secretion periplasmic adaptor subunit n=1 Tax=Poseidonocella sp. HB161398 TaxID=2320855 RepID=UPI0011080BE1|nr:HlyD family type I secretion periplasmic adaptor subunit [Poseidonocella sp. HB161398]
MTQSHEDGIARPLVRAAAVIGLAAAGAGLWLAQAPVSGAVVAEGRFKVDGEVKAVQHLEGGIVREIRVRNGDRVAAGDVLVRLDASESEAALAALSAERDSLRARQIRLEAERDGRVPSFPEAAAPAQPWLASAARSQAALFEARRAELAARDEMLAGRIARLSARLAAQEAEQASVRAQHALAEESAVSARSLADRGIVARRDLDARERDRLMLAGARDALAAGIAETRAAQAEARLDHARARSEYLSAVSRELSEVVAALAALEPRIAAEGERIARSRITAPVDGRINNLGLATLGGVTAPGETMLEIVPAESRLFVEARFPPAARARLREGMAAELRLPGVRSRTEAPLAGRVELISAELSAGAPEVAGDGTRAYTMRIALAAAAPDRQLEPGMPVTAVVATGGRTALQYLVSPLSDAMARSMREE